MTTNSPTITNIITSIRRPNVVWCFEAPTAENACPSLIGGTPIELTPSGTKYGNCGCNGVHETDQGNCIGNVSRSADGKIVSPTENGAKLVCNIKLGTYENIKNCLSPSHVWRFLSKNEKGLLPSMNTSPTTFGEGSAAGMCCDVSPSSTPFPGKCLNLSESNQGNAIGYVKRNTSNNSLVPPDTSPSADVSSVTLVTVTPSDLPKLGLYVTPEPNNPPEPNTSSSSKKLSIGAIIGIVIGSLFGVYILIMYFHWRKRKRNKGSFNFNL